MTVSLTDPFGSPVPPCGCAKA